LLFNVNVKTTNADLCLRPLIGSGWPVADTHFRQVQGELKLMAATP